MQVSDQPTWLVRGGEGFGTQALLFEGPGHVFYHSVIVLAVVQSVSRVRLCDPVSCSTPGFSVLHSLPEFAQTHVH